MTADFNVWPMFSKAILVLLMMLGACAGSTGGGLKISRLLIMVKHIKCEIKRLLHPRAMVSVKIDKKTVESSIISSVLAYLLIYFSLMVVSFLLISINEFDFETSLTSVITCINNVGPGLGAKVGPTGNFSSFTDFSKIILAFDMLLGRLEIFPILLLFSPRMYKRRF